MDNDRQAVLYHEVQRPRQVWIWAIVLFAAGAAWLTLIQQFYIGDETRSTANDIFTIILWLLFGIAFPFFVAIIKLEITVTAGEITARFFPLLTRRFSAGSIAFAGARDYKPLREYGGWGIRHTPRNGRAYTMSGTRGVQMALKDDTLVLLGSQKADELAEVIASIAGITAGIPQPEEPDPPQSGSGKERQ